MIELVEGNTEPPLRFRLVAAGAPLPMSVDDVVLLKFLKPTSGDLVTVTLTVVDAELGIVEGNVGVGDLNETGVIRAELSVDDGSGGVQNSIRPVYLNVRPLFSELDS